MKMSSLPLEDVACPLCDARGARDFVVRPDGMHVVRCNNCDFLYLNPRPVTSALHKLYDSEYYSGGSGVAAYRDYENIQKEALETGWHVGYTIVKVIGEHRDLRGSDVLEIGCGTGALLQMLAKAGARVYGMEAASDVARSVSGSCGLDVRPGTLEDLPFFDQTFDVVILSEVIEHVVDPLAAMRTIESLLKPGGLVFLTTPNAGCGKLLGNEWYGFNTSFEHVVFFDFLSLRDSLARCGLEVLKGSTFGHESPQNAKRSAPTPSLLKKFTKQVLWRFPIILKSIRDFRRARAFGPTEGLHQRHTLWIVARKPVDARSELQYATTEKASLLNSATPIKPSTS